MSTMRKPISSRWAIVLAGGNGERLRPLVEAWLGSPRPKQYCRFLPPESMFERTLRRAECLVPGERIISVVGHDHGDFLEDQRTSGRIFAQPRDLGTLPGLLLPLVHILAEDPDPTVFVFPACHRVEPEGRFLELAGRAADLAELIGTGLVLLGAVPDRAETAHGWIEPGPWVSTADGSLSASWARSFVESPDRQRAHRLFHDGALWNSTVTVARGRALWQIATELAPAIAERFFLLLDVVRAVNAGRAPPGDLSLATSHVYGRMEPGDFRRDLVEAAPHRAAIVPMEGVRWSAWSDPDRIGRSLRAPGERVQPAPGLTRTLQARRVPGPEPAAEAAASLHC